MKMCLFLMDFHFFGFTVSYWHLRLSLFSRQLVFRIKKYRTAGWFLRCRYTRCPESMKHVINSRNQFIDVVSMPTIIFMEWFLLWKIPRLRYSFFFQRFSGLEYDLIFPLSSVDTMVVNGQDYRQKYWGTRSSVRSHRSLIRLLRTARFARALRCAHSFARSLTSLTPSLVGKWLIRWLLNLCFFLFWPIVDYQMHLIRITLRSDGLHSEFISLPLSCVCKYCKIEQNLQVRKTWNHSLE